MKTLVLSGWDTGFEKVKLNKLLRDRFGYSLGQAKKAVDAILENESVELGISDVDLAEIESNLCALRVRFAVRG